MFRGLVRVVTEGLGVIKMVASRCHNWGTKAGPRAGSKLPLRPSRDEMNYS